MRFKCWEYVASCHDRSTRVISYQLLQCFSWQISFFHWHAISTVDPRYFRFPVYSCRQLSRDMLKSAKDLEIALSLALSPSLFRNECSDVDGYMLADEMEASQAWKAFIALVPSTLEKPLDILRRASNAADKFSKLFNSFENTTNDTRHCCIRRTKLVETEAH